jgi:hypothetical protein
MATHTNHCAHCGKTFTSQQPALTCSPRCRVALHRKAKGVMSGVTPERGASLVTVQWPVDATPGEIAEILVKRFGEDWLRSLAGVPPDSVTPEPPPKPSPQPAPKPKSTRKPRPKVTAEEHQAKLAEKFAAGFDPVTLDSRRQMRATTQLSGLGAVRGIDVRTWILRRRSDDGAYRYCSIDYYRAKELRRQHATGAARHRRLHELHPDKLGRKQTPEELAEYTALSKQGRKHK